MIVGLYGVSLGLLMPSVLNIGGFGELGDHISIVSVCLFGVGVHCDHTVRWLDSPMFWAAPNHTSSGLFPVPCGSEVGYGCANYIAEELNANNDK